MAVGGVNNNLYTTATDTDKKAASTRGKGEMDMSDFMNLLVAQMTNQDIFNTASDTEFISQMAQFSSLQGMETLQEYTLSSYAVSYTGKYVIIAHQNEVTGNLEEVTGVVDSVSFYSGSPMVYVNGKGYNLYEVMEVSSTPFKAAEEKKDTTGTESTDVSFYYDDENFDLEAYRDSEEYDPDYPDGLPLDYEK